MKRFDLMFIIIIIKDAVVFLLCFYCVRPEDLIESFGKNLKGRWFELPAGNMKVNIISWIGEKLLPGFFMGQKPEQG